MPKIIYDKLSSAQNMSSSMSINTKFPATAAGRNKTNCVTSYLFSWAQLFKTNDVVSYRDVDVSNIYISCMPISFVKKMLEAFAVKLFSFFHQKKFSVFGYKVVKHLTS